MRGCSSRRRSVGSPKSSDRRSTPAREGETIETAEHTPFRLIWAPGGAVADRSETWTGLVPVPVTGSRSGLAISADARVNVKAGTVDVEGPSAQWTTDSMNHRLKAEVGSDHLRLRIPLAWKAAPYLAWRAGRLLVSGDVRDLAAELHEDRPSLEGVAALLTGSRATMGLAPALYQDIWEAQPGFDVIVDSSGAMRCHRWWRPELDGDFASLGIEATVERLRDDCGTLAERLLQSQGKVACLFSGGLDSTLMAAVLLRHAPEKVVLLNVGSGLGTEAEAALRSRFLHDYSTVTHQIELPAHAGLIDSLRAVNSVAPRPVASPFAHVFEEAIAAAASLGCESIVTGDGGDEIFVEREELIVDLSASDRTLARTAAGHTALREGTRAGQVLRRARTQLRALRAGIPLPEPAGADRVLLSAALDEEAARARRRQAVDAADLWASGWTWSGIGSYRRASTVPDWEPASARLPLFPVISPLADAVLLSDALSLRRASMVATGPGHQPKWVLRQMALAWLSSDIALHPKIGSADGTLLERMRREEFTDVLQLFSSARAREAGFRLGECLEDPRASLWQGDAWIKAAACAAWFDAKPAPRTIRERIALAPTAGRPAVSGHRDAPLRPASRAAVALLAVLNVAAQAVPPGRAPGPHAGRPGQTRIAVDNALSRSLADMTRRSCSQWFTSGSSPVVHRAVAWYLRITGKEAGLRSGRAAGSGERRWWVEVDGNAIELTGAEVPLISGG